MKYQLAVVDRRCVFRNDRRAVEHCIRGDTIDVEFDTEWTQCEHKCAVFVNRADASRITIEIQDGEPIVVPWEVLVTAGEMYVTFIGYHGDICAGGVRLMSRRMDKPFIVCPTDDYDTVIPEATNDVLHRIFGAFESVESAVDRANSAALRAEEAVAAMGTTGVTRNEFDAAIFEIWNVLAKDKGHAYYAGGTLFVPPENISYDPVTETLYLVGSYDPDTETLIVE